MLCFFNVLGYIRCNFFYEIATIVGTTTGSTPRNMLDRLERFELIERDEFKPGKAYKIYIKEIAR